MLIKRISRNLDFRFVCAIFEQTLKLIINYSFRVKNIIGIG